MSEELEKIRPTKHYLKINGKNREIKFSFSAWGELSRKYGGIQNISKLEEDMKNNPFETLPELIYIALVDKEGVEKETVLDEYTIADIEEISTVLMEALTGSLPQDTEKKKATTKKK